LDSAEIDTVYRNVLFVTVKRGKCPPELNEYFMNDTKEIQKNTKDIDKLVSIISLLTKKGITHAYQS
jgi:hypothetical protein